MAVIVEDGTGVVGATSYVSEATLLAFATARGITLAADKTQLLLTAMDYLDNLIFKGMRMRYDQALQWPRGDVWIDGFYQNPTSLPKQLTDGQMQIAIAIDQSNDPVQDLTPSVRREKVGDLEVEYRSGAVALTINRRILHTLYKILDTANGSIRVGKA